MYKDIRERAMLVKFSDSVWTATKQDTKATNYVLDAHEAKKGAGVFKAKLLSKAALEKRWDVSHAARAYHVKMTSPWLDEGVRILAIGLFPEYMAQMRKYQASARDADREFFKELTAHIEEAKKLRGKMFDPTDYPNEDVLKGKFRFDVTALPLPDIADWRAPGLAAKDMEALTKQAEATVNMAMKDAVVEIFERLTKVLDHAREKLKDSNAKFRDSLIGNIKAVCELAPKLNVMGDATLTKMVKEVETALSKLNPDELRENKGMRAKAAKDADAILKRMSVYMGQAQKEVK